MAYKDLNLNLNKYLKEPIKNVRTVNNALAPKNLDSIVKNAFS